MASFAPLASASRLRSQTATPVGPWQPQGQPSEASTWLATALAAPPEVQPPLLGQQNPQSFVRIRSPAQPRSWPSLTATESPSSPMEAFERAAVWLRFGHVDYRALAARPALLSAFRSSVRDVVASELAGVEPSDVSVQLLKPIGDSSPAGGDGVLAHVQVAPQASGQASFASLDSGSVASGAAAQVQAQLCGDAFLLDGVAAAVGNLDGIGQVCSGPIAASGPFAAGGLPCRRLHQDAPLPEPMPPPQRPPAAGPDFWSAVRDSVLGEELRVLGAGQLSAWISATGTAPPSGDAPPGYPARAAGVLEDGGGGGLAPAAATGFWAAPQPAAPLAGGVGWAGSPSATAAVPPASVALANAGAAAVPPPPMSQAEPASLAAAGAWPVQAPAAQWPARPRPTLLQRGLPMPAPWAAGLANADGGDSVEGYAGRPASGVGDVSAGALAAFVGGYKVGEKPTEGQEQVEVKAPAPAPGPSELCDPECIPDRGICLEGVCYCREPYYGSLCDKEADLGIRVGMMELFFITVLVAVLGVFIAAQLADWMHRPSEFSEPHVVHAPLPEVWKREDPNPGDDAEEDKELPPEGQQSAHGPYRLVPQLF